MSPSMIATTTTVTMTTNVIVRSSPQLGQMTLRSSPTMSSKLRMMPRRGAGAGRCITLFGLGSVGTVLAMVVIPESGRGGATRTPDPRFWRPLLYQLSYTPVPVGANSIRRLPPLLGFLVGGVFPAPGAELLDLQPVGVILLVLHGGVVALLTCLTLQGDGRG